MEPRQDPSHLVPAPHFVPRPPLEDVLTLINLASRDDVTYSSLVAALESRPALAAMFSRTANSIGVGAVRGIRDMRHGLAILGLARIRGMLYSMRETLNEDRERARVAS